MATEQQPKYIRIPFIPRFMVFGLMLLFAMFSLAFIMIYFNEGIQTSFDAKLGISIPLFILLCFVLFNKKLSDRILFMGEQSPEEIQKDFEIKKKDAGGYTYTSEGFTKGDVTVKWNDINEIIVHLRDLYSIDQYALIMSISNEEPFTITEDTPGWHIFIKQLKAHVAGAAGIDIALLSLYASDSKTLLVYRKE